MKPPFKAEPEDKIFCPNAGHVVSVDAYCHGWAFRNELCHDAETCEAYLDFAERRLTDLSSEGANQIERPNQRATEVNAHV